MRLSKNFKTGEIWDVHKIISGEIRRTTGTSYSVLVKQKMIALNIV